MEFEDSMPALEKLATEKMLLNMTDSSFITRLHATHFDAQFMYLILEPALGGNLKEVYQRESFHDMNHVVKYHTAGIALAIGHLHERQICHRDLKPDNVLLNEKGHIKVCDLGLAKRFFDKTATFCGTALYMAPEIHAGRWYTHAVDWWSFGVIVYELLSGCDGLLAEPRRPGLFYTKALPSTMDPTETELQAITNLAGVFTWSGIAGALERALKEALGDPARVRELAVVPRPAWDEMARDLQVRGPPATDGTPGPLRDLTQPTQGQIRASVMKGIRNFGSMQLDCVDFIRAACAARPPLEKLKAMPWYRDVQWGRIERGDVPASWVPKRQPLAGPRSFPRNLHHACTKTLQWISLAWEIRGAQLPRKYDLLTSSSYAQLAKGTT
eukprot:s1457_g10.t1